MCTRWCVLLPENLTRIYFNFDSRQHKKFCQIRKPSHIQKCVSIDTNYCLKLLYELINLSLMPGQVLWVLNARKQCLTSVCIHSISVALHTWTKESQIFNFYSNLFIHFSITPPLYTALKWDKMTCSYLFVLN